MELGDLKGLTRALCSAGLLVYKRTLAKVDLLAVGVCEGDSEGCRVPGGGL